MEYAGQRQPPTRLSRTGARRRGDGAAGVLENDLSLTMAAMFDPVIQVRACAAPASRRESLLIPPLPAACPITQEMSKTLAGTGIVQPLPPPRPGAAGCSTSTPLGAAASRRRTRVAGGTRLAPDLAQRDAYDPEPAHPRASGSQPRAPLAGAQTQPLRLPRAPLPGARLGPDHAPGRLGAARIRPRARIRFACD